MKLSRISAPLLGLTCLLTASIAQAEPYHDVPPRPAFAGYALQGGLLGTGLGASLAHLVDRGGDSDWRQWVTITGVGALSGIAGGTVVSFADAQGYAADTGSDYGYYTLRTMNQGQFVGAFTGAAAGGLVWLNDGEALNVADGASIGAFAGALTGALFAAIAHEPQKPARPERRGVNIRVGAAGVDGAPALFAAGTF